MLAPRTEAVLQAAAFGDLVDRTTLDRVLAESVEARDRFATLQDLAADLRAHGAVDAPADMKAAVMQGIAARTRTFSGGPDAAVSSRTGETMSKKVMLGVAATVAAALGIYAAMGGSVQSQGTAGTIGAAKRYQGQQLSASDVQLGDQAMQSFLQSPAFDKLRRDPAARKTFQKVVTNVNFAQLAGSDAFKQLVSDANFSQLVSDANFSQLLNDAKFSQLVSDAKFSQLVSDADFRQLVSDADLRKLVSDANFSHLLSDANFSHLVNDARFSNLSPDAFMSAFDASFASGPK
jgi:hypothetical protein